MALRDVKGHDRAVSILIRTIERDRVPSAYLFTGESGIGKRHTALNFAKAVNCQHDQGALFAAGGGTSDAQIEPDSCDACGSCRKIDTGTHPDLIVVAPEKGEIRVDEIRDVTDALSLRAYEGRKKVAIIDDADTMNQSAANAFLKTLEEPPDESLIILIASNSERLPETIRSRCSLVRFTTLPTDACGEVIRTVQEKQLKGKGQKREPLADDRLFAAVRLAMGRPGLALSSDLLAERERFLRLLESMLGDGGETWADREEMEQWLDMAAIVLRDMVLLKTTDRAGMLFHEDIAGTLAGMSKRAEARSLMTLYGGINRLRGKVDFNLNKAITWNCTASMMKAVMVRRERA
jgi:DNA polymerase-3 subunit delta'